MKGLYQKLTQGRIGNAIRAGLVGLALAGCDMGYSAQPNSETQKIVHSGNPEKPLRFYNGPAPVPASQKSNNIPFSPNLVQGDYTPEIAPPPPKRYDGEYNEILEGIEKFKLRIDELDETYNYLPGKTKDLDRVRIYTEKLKKMNEEDRKKLISETKGKGVTYYFDAGYYDLTPELGKHVTDSSNLFEISKFTIILNYINRDGIMSSEEKRFIKERCPKIMKK